MTVVGFRGPYEEAFQLLVDARDYMMWFADGDRSRLSLSDRLVFSCETMRLTSRVTQVMAWLMVRRAVEAGEMTADAAREACWRLDGQSVCDPSMVPAPDEAMPARLTHLLSRSGALYARIDRLDQSLDRAA